MSIDSDKIYVEKDYGVADRTIIGAVANKPNTNLAIPTNFLFSFRKIPTMTYFIQEFTLPECGAEPLGSEFMIGPTVKFPKSSFSYGTLSLKFLINEDFSNYYAVVQWILENTGYQSFVTKQNYNEGASEEGSLILLTNKKNPFRKIDFVGLIPVDLSGLEFSNDVVDITTMSATLKFSISGYTTTNL
jgi:hypothetical protein